MCVSVCCGWFFYFGTFSEINFVNEAGGTRDIWTMATAAGQQLPEKPPQPQARQRTQHTQTHTHTYLIVLTEAYTQKS